MINFKKTNLGYCNLMAYLREEGHLRVCQTDCFLVLSFLNFLVEKKVKTVETMQILNCFHNLNRLTHDIFLKSLIVLLFCITLPAFMFFFSALRTGFVLFFHSYTIQRFSFTSE